MESPGPGGPDISGSGALGAPDLGAPDLGGLLSQMQHVQQQLMDAQAATASRIVQGRSGGGAVVVTTTGGLDFREVKIDPAVVDHSDVDMLQDLVLAAVRDAVEQANNLNSQTLGGLGLGGGLEGLLGG